MIPAAAPHHPQSNSILIVQLHLWSSTNMQIQIQIQKEIQTQIQMNEEASI